MLFEHDNTNIGKILFISESMHIHMTCVYVVLVVVSLSFIYTTVVL